MKLLSVLVPVYNAGKINLEKCLNSILGQTLHNLEIIIVDDGSTDRSPELCRRFADRDPRIVLLHQDHLGVTPARKAGIERASGEYITFVDSDDWVDQDYYKRLAGHAGDADIVIAGSYYREPEHRRISEPVAEGMYSGSKTKDIWRRAFDDGMSENVSIYLWNKIFKAGLIKRVAKHIWDDINIHEDRCITIQSLLLAEKIRVTKETGYHYCVREDSLTGSVRMDYLINLNRYYLCMREALERHPSKEELLSALGRELINKIRCGNCFWRLGIDKKARFFYYPYYGRLEGARIILYGAGQVGQSFHQQIVMQRESIVLAWADANWKNYRAQGLDVISPDEILKLEFDYIIIAVYDKNSAAKIREELSWRGIPENRILWNKTRLY